MRNLTSLDNNQGYIALFAALIITSVLLAVVMSGSALGFFTRTDILGSEVKEKSYSLAEACIHTALVEIFLGEDLSAGKVVTLDSVANPVEECTIRPYASGSTVEAEAEYQNAHTNLRVTFDGGYNILTWAELESI